MAVLQAVVPQEIADAVEREASSRVPKSSMSKVIAEVVIPAFAERAKSTPPKRHARRQPAK